jgi:hypothetical protein
MPPDPTQQPPVLTTQPANQFGPSVKSFSPGFLFSCQYMFFKHDPNPLVLMTKVYPDQRIAGVNLHYLTFPYVRHLIREYCGKGTFSYQAIKGDRFIANAFRTYKRAGLRGVKAIDCQFLISILGQLRSFNPAEIEAMRKEVQRQLRERINPKADELARQLSQAVPPGKADFGLSRPTQSPLATPTLGSVPGTGTIPGQPGSIPGQTG